jgi:hypothetical protein
MRDEDFSPQMTQMDADGKRMRSKRIDPEMGRE